MTVEERLAALEAQVAELRAELAKRREWHSIARSLTCPACGGGSFIVVKQVKDFIANAKFITMSLNPSPNLWRGPQGDPLHVYVCKECRLVEWRVATLDHLEPDGENIVELNRPDEDTGPSHPYR